MTKKNVAISDARSGFNMAVLNSPVFVQKPPTAPGGYISISRKKVLKNLDINRAQRISSWVDSMRASSPTHVKSTPSSLAEDHPSLMVSQFNSQSLLFFFPSQFGQINQL